MFVPYWPPSPRLHVDLHESPVLEINEVLRRQVSDVRDNVAISEIFAEIGGQQPKAMRPHDSHLMTFCAGIGKRDRQVRPLDVALLAIPSYGCLDRLLRFAG